MRQNETELDPRWLSLWVAIGVALWAFSDFIAAPISAETLWEKDTVNQTIKWGAVFIVAATAIIALYHKVFRALPGLLTPVYRFQVKSSKFILSPIIRLILVGLDLAARSFKQLLSLISSIWASLIRRLTLALLRSVDIEPDALHRWVEAAESKLRELQRRVDEIEASPIVDEFSIQILKILKNKKPAAALALIKRNDDLGSMGDGLHESELAMLLDLSSEEIGKLRTALLRLYILQMIEPIYVKDGTTWWEAPHGAYFMMEHKRINEGDNP